MADEIAVDETGWPVVTNRQVQYPARVRIVPTAEDDVVDLEAVPGDVEAEGTDVGEGLFGAVRNYVDSRDGTKADGAYVEQEVGRVDGALAELGERVDGVAGDVEAKVSRSGDTMTGDLNVSNVSNGRPIVRLMTGNQYAALYHDSYGTSLGFFEDGVKQNRLLLRGDSSILEKPLTVASGGTGAADAQDACYNLINGRIIKPQTIELGTDIANDTGGFIDFHYNGSSADYTSRIIESAPGTVSVNGTPFKFGAGLPVANGGTGMTGPATITLAKASTANSMAIDNAKQWGRVVMVSGSANIPAPSGSWFTTVFATGAPKPAASVFGYAERADTRYVSMCGVNTSGQLYIKGVGGSAPDAGNWFFFLVYIMA